jgi:hypothetical protein
MTFSAPTEQKLLEKIRQLPLEKQIEVADFVDFLTQQSGDRGITLAATKLAEPVFQRIWDNPEDAEYDNL